MLSQALIVPVVFIAFASPAANVTGQDARGVRGRVVVDGQVAPRKPLSPGRDACCQQAAPLDERVVVGAENGLANVVVSIESRRGEQPPPRSSTTDAPAKLTNKGCAFRPRVVIARVGKSLTLANDDPTMHNVNIQFVRNRAVNVVVEPEGRREVPLVKAERKPVAVRCNVHTFMAGWVVVRDDPYAVVTDSDGSFQLPKLPEGKWRLRFWHEGRPLPGLAVAAGVTDDRGEVLVVVDSSESIDLGVVRVEAAKLR